MLNTESPQIEAQHITHGDGSTSPNRPICKCGKHSPTINGRCPEHMDVETEGRLCCLSPADLGLPGK